MVWKKIVVGCLLYGLSVEARADFRNSLDTIALVGAGVSAAALSAALIWEGVVQAQDFYQRSYVTDVQNTIEKIESRYSFLLQADWHNKQQLVELLAVKQVDFERLNKNLAQDFDDLVYGYDLLCRVIETWKTEFRYQYLLVSADNAIKRAVSIIAPLRAWKNFLQKNAKFFELALFLRRKSVPSYSVYERYPLIVYVEELSDQRSMLQDIYYDFLAEWDQLCLEDRDLMEKAQQRIEFLNCEIGRVIESVGYHQEKELQAQIAWREEKTEHALDGAYLYM